MWIRFGNDVDNERFGLAVHRGDKVMCPFGVDLQSVDPVRLTYDDASCRTSRAYGDVEQSVQCLFSGRVALVVVHEQPSCLFTPTLYASEWSSDMGLSLASKVRVVLVETTHPGNIGAVARAMKTMGLRRLSLVSPKTFPSAYATARAAGADDILYHATISDSLGEALAGSGWIVGSSARVRHIPWPELNPRDCARRVVEQTFKGEVAIVFGRESAGLTNQELEQCNGVVRIPTDESFTSLNLASAVQIIGYEIQLAALSAQTPTAEPTESPVTNEEMERFYTHLREALIEIDFLDESAPKLLMRRLKKLFNRVEPNHSEVNILRGILTAAQRVARR